MTTAINPIPGYRRNALGHLVPEGEVPEHEKLRDEVTRELAAEAEELSRRLTAFKKKALGDIAGLVQLAAERHEVKLGGEKGNITITSYDGSYKILRTYAEVVQFTESVEAAKALIEECMSNWSEGANSHLRVLVQAAFRSNRNGDLKTGRVIELLSYPIDDPDWQRGMQALREAIQVTGRAVYVRVYKREPNSKQYRPIPLDIAAVGGPSQ